MNTYNFLSFFIILSNINTLLAYIKYYNTKEPSSASVRLSNLYQDGMVLQRRPYKATIWGYGIIPDEIKAITNCTLYGNIMNGMESPVTQINNQIWQTEVGPIEGGAICNISMPIPNNFLQLNNVLFGDVWLCGGQSNMGFQLNRVYNATQELKDARKYTDIRFTSIKRESAESLDEDMDIRMVHDWKQPSSLYLGQMSAVCFLYAKYIYDHIGVPIGLIDSCIGGTRIESWSTQNVLESCGAEREQLNCEAPDYIYCNKRLYNKMINPLKRNTFKGFLWYQGESNTAWHADKYTCTFSSMIDAWRSEFSSHSNTNRLAPFGFVQLSTIKYGDEGLGMSIIRWHQTADRGIVPNEVLRNVFMAVAIDTYDEVWQIHPRYKQIVGKRLSIAGMNVAYGNATFRTNGPFVTSLDLISGTTVSLTYNQQITYDQAEISGFYYCCKDDFDYCDIVPRNWVEIGKERVILNSTKMDVDVIEIDVANLPVCHRIPHIAYLWRETPIKGYLAAPIYGSDQFRLPSAPWKAVII